VSSLPIELDKTTITGFEQKSPFPGNKHLGDTGIAFGL
jgi:hypothetical protein